MNALLSIMLLFAIHREREPVYYQHSDSLKPIVVETENKLSLTLNLVKSACIDSCYFISHVYTPVCEENICYPIELEIRWDLLGYFKDYETPVKHPETICDYEISAYTADQWTTIVQAEGNYQRKVEHIVQPVLTNRLRLTINKTNGDPLARLFEIRCYT